MQPIQRLLFVSLLCLCCAGCLYPQDKRQQLDRLPEQINQVQSGVDAYMQTHSTPPYTYKKEERPFTTHYLVDFKVLQSTGAEIPPSAFEKGGNFLYVLINMEKKPIVRLYDLRIQKKVGDVESAIRYYQQQNKQLPLGKPVAQGFYAIDYQRLKEDAVRIPSPYDTQGQMDLMVDRHGRVYIDYRAEAMKQIQHMGNQLPEGTDLRLWLAQQSFYVPAYSPPMIWKKGEPVLQVDSA